MKLFTATNLLALIFLIGIPLAVGDSVEERLGLWPGIGAGILSTALLFGLITLYYRCVDRQTEQRRCEYREKYRDVYRALAVPGDLQDIRKPDGAQLMVGDYGWEAEPFHDDGLIYLQGLTPDWCVVWHAGFRLDQIERVGPKPRSQYDWDHTFLDYSAPPCPYPVQERKTTAMGLPV